MTELDEIRVDKWLFAVRLFKTRGQASEACRKGKIKLNDLTIKAAKSIKIGDIVKVRQGPIIRSLEVINLTERRIGPKLVENFAQDITPKEELENYHKAIRNRDENKSQGRPSKKERKLINQFMELGGK